MTHGCSKQKGLGKLVEFFSLKKYPEIIRDIQPYHVSESVHMS